MAYVRRPKPYRGVTWNMRRGYGGAFRLPEPRSSLGLSTLRRPKFDDSIITRRWELVADLFETHDYVALQELKGERDIHEADFNSFAARIGARPFVSLAKVSELTGRRRWGVGFLLKIKNVSEEWCSQEIIEGACMAIWSPSEKRGFIVCYWDSSSLANRLHQYSRLREFLGDYRDFHWSLPGDQNRADDKFDRYIKATADRPGYFTMSTRAEVEAWGALLSDFGLTEVHYSFHGFQHPRFSGRPDRTYVTWREAWASLIKLHCKPVYVRRARDLYVDHAPISMSWENCETPETENLAPCKGVADRVTKLPGFGPLHMTYWARLVKSREGVELWEEATGSRDEDSDSPRTRQRAHLAEHWNDPVDSSELIFWQGRVGRSQANPTPLPERPRLRIPGGTRQGGPQDGERGLTRTDFRTWTREQFPAQWEVVNGQVTNGPPTPLERPTPAGARPAWVEQQEEERLGRPLYGFRARPVTHPMDPNSLALRIFELDEGSPASLAGLKNGAFLVAVNGYRGLELLERSSVLREFDTLEVEAYLWEPPIRPPTLPETTNYTLGAATVPAARLLKHYHDAAEWAASDLVRTRQEDLQAIPEFQISALINLLRLADQDLDVEIHEASFRRLLQKWPFLREYVRENYSLRTRRRDIVIDVRAAELKVEQIQRSLFQEELMDLHRGRGDMSLEEFSKRKDTLLHKLCRRRVCKQIENAVLVDENNVLLTEPVDICAFLKRRWAIRWRRKTSNTDLIDDAMDWPDFLPEGRTLESAGQSWEDPTVDEAKGLLKKIRLNGVGLDRRSAGIYKQSIHEMAQLLVRLPKEMGSEDWERTLQALDEPSLDLAAFLRFLYKSPVGVGPQGELIFTENGVRPVTIFTHLIRILQRLENIPLLRTLHPVFPEVFYGWRPGGQMDEPIVAVNTWSNIMKMMERLGFNLFVDQESAFPYAVRAAISHMMHRLHYPARVIKKILWLIGDCRHVIKWGRRMYEGPEALDGLSQGGGLSPTLLLLLNWLCWAMLEMEKESDPLHPETTQAWWADDLNLRRELPDMTTGDLETTPSMNLTAPLQHFLLDTFGDGEQTCCGPQETSELVRDFLAPFEADFSATDRWQAAHALVEERVNRCVDDGSLKWEPGTDECGDFNDTEVLVPGQMDPDLATLPASQGRRHQLISENLRQAVGDQALDMEGDDEGGSQAIPSFEIQPRSSVWVRVDFPLQREARTVFTSDIAGQAPLLFVKGDIITTVQWDHPQADRALCSVKLTDPVYEGHVVRGLPRSRLFPGEWDSDHPAFRPPAISPSQARPIQEGSGWSDTGEQQMRSFLRATKRAFDKYRAAAGGVLNIRKTKLLPTDLLTDPKMIALKQMLREEGWSELEVVEEFVYLGVTQGPLVGAPQVYRRAIGRTEEKMQIWKPKAWGKNLSALIWKTFFVPTYQFPAKFFRPTPQIKTTMNRQMRTLARTPQRWGSPNLWYSDWLFGVPEHFVNGVFWCEASVLRTYLANKHLIPDLPRGFRRRKGIARTCTVRQWEIGATLFKKQTGATVFELHARWESFESAKRWRATRPRGARGLRPPPEWVGTNPRPRDAVVCASDGSCFANQDTWGKSSRSTWSSSVYKGRSRRWLSSGYTVTDPCDPAWKGLFGGSAQGGEVQGVLECLVAVKRGLAGPRPTECVIGSDNLSTVRCGANEGHLRAEPVAEWYMWLLELILTRQGTQVAFLHWYGHQGLGLNEEANAFAQQHHSRADARWRARLQQAAPGIGHVEPPAQDTLRSTSSSFLPPDEWAEAPFDPWTREAEGPRKPGLLSMFYSFRRSRAWMPKHWELPGGEGCFCDAATAMMNRNGVMRQALPSAENRAWLGTLRFKKAPPRWLWGIGACLLDEVYLPSRLWLNGGKKRGDPRPDCACCGRRRCSWGHILGQGEDPCVVIQAFAASRKMTLDSEDVEGEEIEEEAPEHQEGEDAFEASGDEALGPNDVLMEDDLADPGEDFDPWAEEPRPRPAPKRGPAPRQRRRLQPQVQLPPGDLPGPDVSLWPVDLARRWTGSPIPAHEDRSWKHQLGTRKGGLLLATIYQYFLWKRFSWSAAAVVDPLKEFRRLEAAWQHVKRW